MLQNLGCWQGSFTRLSTKGEILEDIPSETSLELKEDNQTVRQVVRRFYDGQPQNLVLEYRTLNRSTTFFENGAFSQGGLQFAPYTEFGGELGLIYGDRRLRVVLLYDKASQLDRVTFIREHLPHSTTPEHPALTLNDLLGKWEGEAITIAADWLEPEIVKACFASLDVIKSNYQTTMSLPPIIEQMLSPEFYEHPVTEPIQLLQTHISFVLLTGQYAYKVKKPMNFGFLDFSTLEKRKYFCEEELRLNRRLAPDLYLSVLPIIETDGKYHFDQARIGTPVEYAIAMPEFSQEDLLIEMFASGRLTADHVKQIGEQLAVFHQSALTNDHINSFGTMEAVLAVANDNYASTEKYVGIAQTDEQLAQTRAYTDKFFEENAALFSDRIAKGKVRECHGDVHLKNICLYQDQIQIFDCIEFNEPFRNSDVLYDAAFLLMDLQFRSRRDLANIFLNTYLERTGDYEGAVLLPLHCSMRAYIRAKVTSFLLDDPNIPTDVKANAQTEASAYYKLAWEYTQPKQGKLIIMSGVSGSGKSTTAKAIASEQDAIYLRSDAIRKQIAGIGLMERGSDDIYTPEMTAKTYTRLAELGALLASKGFTVILDAKYDRISLRGQAIAAVQDQNIPVEIIYCTAPVEVLEQRLRDRSAANNDIADATVELLASQQAAFEDFTAEELVLVKKND